jgi:hypothetical protein
MRRTYVVISILLLILGVASTFALTYVQTELEEPWGAQYTLQYTGSSIELSNPQTTINDDDSVTVKFDITPNDKDVKCKFVIVPLDINNDKIKADADGGTTDITITAVGASYPGIATKVTSTGANMEVSYSMIDAYKVGKITIEWDNTGFFSEYESVQIFIEDIE